MCCPRLKGRGSVRFFDAFYTIFAEMILSNLSHLGDAYKTSVFICTGILPEAFRVSNKSDGGRQRCARFVCCSLSLPRPLSPPEKLPYASKVTASKRWMKRSDDCNQIVLTYFTFTDSTVNIAKSNDFGRFFHTHLNASWGIDENRRRQSVVSFSSTRRRRPSKASEGRHMPSNGQTDTKRTAASKNHGTVCCHSEGTSEGRTSPAEPN